MNGAGPNQNNGLLPLRPLGRAVRHFSFSDKHRTDMIKEIELALTPAAATEEDQIKAQLLRKLGPAARDLTDYRLLKRSIDARGRQPLVRLRVEAYLGESFTPEPALLDQLRDVSAAPPVIIAAWCRPAGIMNGRRPTTANSPISSAPPRKPSASPAAGGSAAPRREPRVVPAVEALRQQHAGASHGRIRPLDFP